MFRQSRVRSRSPRALLALVVAALVAVFLPAVASSIASAAPKPPAPTEPVATKIAFGAIVRDGTALPETLGTVGIAYVVAGKTFDVTVRFLDANENEAPLSTTKSVKVTLSVEGLAQRTRDAVPGAVSVTFDDLKIDNAASELTMTASADTKPRALTTSRQFDVLISEAEISTAERTSIGGDATSEGCSPGTPTATTSPGLSVCADLLPPSRGFVAGGFLSQGECSADCQDTYIQALVALTADRLDPATVIMKCDKDECGVGSIRKQKLEVILSPGDPRFDEPITAAECPAKGTVGVFNPDATYGPDNAPFCVDYVQSTRSNAGDTFLYLLFTEDAKIRFP